MRFGLILLVLGVYGFALLFGMGIGMIYAGEDVLVERWHTGLWVLGAIALAGAAEVLR